MTEERHAAKLAEVDDLINNPDMPLCPARIWQLMEEISVAGDHGVADVPAKNRCAAVSERAISETMLNP